MRRLVSDITNGIYPTHSVDVAVIGSGLAGMYTAYHLDDKLSVALFTKERVEDSSSSLAQGGIAAVTEKDDAFLYHFQDTINAGAGLCDESAVHVIVEEGPREIEQLLALGTKFDLDRDGSLMTTREGGHGMSRILHAGGDATGLEMVRTLKKAVKKKDNVTIHKNAFAADILTDGERVIALTVFEDGQWHIYHTSHVVVAAGGIGQIYRYTTNPSVATGDGLALAQRAGAKLNDMEFIQFHPTGLYTPENRNKQCFLISEAVRGEGGKLYNYEGQRYMKGRHPLAELAPRDIVARENYREIQNQKSPYVQLDITHKSEAFLKKRFPTIYNRCIEHGIDISKDTIPVGPVQHYMMGGIATDLMGRTNIQGLLACGEAACTGVHGANRLASNSTLECLVFGRRCAGVINDDFVPPPASDVHFNSGDTNPMPLNTNEAVIELKGIMVKYCGILRNGPNLQYGRQLAVEMLKKLKNARLETLHDIELYNMASIAIEIFNAALSRKRSVGAHYRIDEGRTYL